MNNKILSKGIVLYLLFYLMPFCLKAQVLNKLPDPEIKIGTAKVSGSVSNLKLPKGEKLQFVVATSSPISGDEEEPYTTNVDFYNNFVLTIPLTCNKQIVSCALCTDSINYWVGFIGLDQKNELHINFSFDAKLQITVDAKGGLNLTAEDSHNMYEAIDKFLTCRHGGFFYGKNPTEFKNYELGTVLKDRIQYSIDSLNLSEKAKAYLFDTFNIKFISGRLFYYKENAEKTHEQETKSGNNKSPKAYKAEEPDKSYYSFLSQYPLNSPQLLYIYGYYSDFIRHILSAKAFQIPDIENTPIEKWLEVVRNHIKDVVGFDSGLFYDMLAANAYTRQIDDNRKPLTKEQVENIEDYYKTRNSDITRLILDKNKKLLKLLEQNNDLKIKSVPAVPLKDLLSAIVSRYRGKVVLMDFWATWCGPCMRAHQEMSSIKEELKKKGVVFVYIANYSSPKQLWEGKIRGIGGEHYYLNKKEMHYIWNQLKMEGNPTYLIYDKKGRLKQQILGFPGTDTIKDELLKLSY